MNEKKSRLVRFVTVPVGITYDGRYVYSNGFSKPRTYEWFVSGAENEDWANTIENMSVAPPPYIQYRPGVYWENLHAGLKQRMFFSNKRATLDRTAPFAYCFDPQERRYEAYSLDRDLCQEPEAIPAVGFGRGWLAATIDRTTYFCSFDGKNLVRTAWAHKSQSQGSPASLPQQVTVGKQVKAQVPGADKDSPCAMTKGPKGLDVSAAGEISWTPGEADIGQPAIRFRVMKNGVPEFVSWEVEVLPLKEEDRAIAKGVRYAVLTDSYRLAPSLDRKRILFLQDGLLVILDAASLREISRAFLGEYYQFIAERPEYYLAVAHTHADLLEKKSFKMLRSIELPTREVLDLAPSPTQDISFIVGRFQGGCRGMVYCIHEGQGVVTLDPPFQAARVIVSPAGKTLYVCGYLNQGDDAETPLYQGVLHRVDISRTPAKVLQSFRIFTLGMPIPDYELYPDESAILVPFRPCKKNAGPFEQRTYSGPEVPPNCACSLRASNFNKSACTFEVDFDASQFFLGAFAVHPALPYLAASDKKGLRIVNSKTGRVVENKLEFPDEPIRNICRLAWTPSGRTLLVDHAITERGGCQRWLEPIGLKLTEAERKMLEIAAAPPPKFSSVPAANPPENPKLPQRSDLDALTSDRPEQPVAMSMVNVMLTKIGPFSSGICVGKEGYILTQSWHLPLLNDPSITYFTYTKTKETVPRKSAPGGRKPSPAPSPSGGLWDPKPVTVPAKIIKIDPVLGLALLKADKLPDVVPASLSKNPPADGEKGVRIGVNSRRDVTVKLRYGGYSHPKHVSVGDDGGTIFDLQDRLSYFPIRSGFVSSATIREFLEGCVSRE